MVVAAILLQGGGCTVIGLSTGLIIDAASSDANRTQVEDLPRVERGKRIEIATKDNTTIAGIFDTVRSLPDSVYVRNITESSHQTRLPRPHDSIAVYLTDSTELRGLFSEFHYMSDRRPSSLKFGFTIGPIVPVECELIGTAPNNIPLNYISHLQTTNGTQYDGEAIRSLADARQLPINSAVDVLNGRDRLNIEFDDIKFVDVKRSKNAKWIGLGVGLLLDAVVFVAIAIDGFDFGTGGFGGGGGIDVY
jgi:hypothetical protein